MAKHHVSVRLYGTCEHLYADPWKSNTEFKMMLQRENKSAMEVFREVFKKELSHINSPSDSVEEVTNMEATAKTSSRKVRKKKGLKESTVTEVMGEDTKDQYSAERHQEHGNVATTVVATRRGRRTQEGGMQSSPTNEKYKAIGEASTKGSSYKTGKQVAVVSDKEACKMKVVGTSVVRREGLRRSSRTPMKAYLDASEDGASKLNDTHASEDADEVGNRTSENLNQHKYDSSLDGTLASHAEIRTMVRDILVGDIIAKQHAAEMAYVDAVISGICGASEENMAGVTTAVAMGGQGIKRSGSGVEAESCNLIQISKKGRVDQATSDPKKSAKEGIMEIEDSNGDSSNYLKGASSRDAGKEELGQASARQIRIMQSLGLIAPSGSPFGKNGLVASTLQRP
ncbi:hypothetical protein GUJ93_ZPchr0010g7254 [Zizania palustris]|uniref:Uncharacterized protein n=1 Tax=Zizania palustris TaxID=103762 RepID=A0A8J5WFK9_ZIZPA|nr:hypothetical protein GUJ93_ZPchr0010g7254 [Zizania palustris]